MKAAILTGRDPQHFAGGIENYCGQLTRLLQKRGVSADVYHCDSVTPSRGWSEFESRCFEIGRAFNARDRQYDFVLANSYFGFGYFPPRVRTYTVYHISHAAFAEAIRDVVPPSEYLKYLSLCGEIGDVVSAFRRVNVAVSESVREELERHHGMTDVQVVLNGVDTQLFRPIADRNLLKEQWQIPQKALVGIYVGRWDLTKGCDILEPVIRNTPEVYWILALSPGGFPCPLQGVAGVIIKEGLTQDRLVELYSLADFMLFPSRYESFGYAIVEAMACELPVIVTPVGVAKETYADEPFHQLLLPAFSSGKETLVASALHAILALRTKRGLRKDVGMAGRSVVTSHFSLARWEAEMESLLGLGAANE
jgi:glycosyltransferase involved in cell wall biosynthesis